MKMCVHRINARLKLGLQSPGRSRKKNILAGLIASAISATAFAGSAAYQYDTLGRLTQVTYSNGVVITYVYDAAGNRTSQTVSGVPAAAAMSRKAQ